MTGMDQAAFERALQVAFSAGYGEGYSDRDHHCDPNASESYDYWLNSDDGKNTVSQAKVKS